MPTGEIVELVVVLGWPFVLSFVNTFGIAVPPVAGIVPFSVTGFTIGVTLTVSTTDAHVTGVNLSHNWYVIG